MVAKVTREGAGGARADRGTVDVAGALRAASPTGVGVVVGGARRATGVVPVSAGDRASGADARRTDSCSARPSPTDLTANPTGAATRPHDRDIRLGASGVWHPGTATAASAAAAGSAASRSAPESIRLGNRGVRNAGITATAAATPAAACGSTRASHSAVRPSHAATCSRIATSSVSAARAHPCLQLWIQTTRRRRGD